MKDRGSRVRKLGHGVGRGSREEDKEWKSAKFITNNYVYFIANKHHHKSLIV